AVVLILLGVAAIGLELGLRKSIGDRLDREIATSMGSQADVDVGARPALLSYFSGSLETVPVTTDRTPADGVAGPGPATDLPAEGAIGLALGLRKSIAARRARESPTTMRSQPDGALGARPVLLSCFSGSLETVHMTTDGTPAEGGAGPVPAIDSTAEGVREE